MKMKTQHAKAIEYDEGSPEEKFTSQCLYKKTRDISKE